MTPTAVPAMPATTMTIRNLRRRLVRGRIRRPLRIIVVAVPKTAQLESREQDEREDEEQQPSELAAEPVRQVAELGDVVLGLADRAVAGDLPALDAGVRVALGDERDALRQDPHLRDAVGEKPVGVLRVAEADDVPDLRLERRDRLHDDDVAGRD